MPLAADNKIHTIHIHKIHRKKEIKSITGLKSITHVRSGLYSLLTVSGVWKHFTSSVGDISAVCFGVIAFIMRRSNVHRFIWSVGSSHETAMFGYVASLSEDTLPHTRHSNVSSPLWPQQETFLLPPKQVAGPDTICQQHTLFSSVVTVIAVVIKL